MILGLQIAGFDVELFICVLWKGISLYHILLHGGEGRCAGCSVRQGGWEAENCLRNTLHLCKQAKC